MFVITGLISVLLFAAIFLPPDFDHWEQCKLMLLSNNPLVYSAGFIMCTFYALEFIVWYVVLMGFLRLLRMLLPFVFLYLVFKMFTLTPEDVSRVKSPTAPPSIHELSSPALESHDELIRRQQERERSGW